MSESTPAVPVTRATNAYELLEEFKEIIRQEPRRCDMDTWVTKPEDVTPEMRPLCDTIACAGGWIVILVDGRRAAYRYSTYIQERATNLLFGGRTQGVYGPKWADMTEEERERFLDIRTLFSATVYDEDEYLIEAGDPQYIPLVIERITKFQEQYEPALRAAILANAGPSIEELYKENAAHYLTEETEQEEEPGMDLPDDQEG